MPDTIRTLAELNALLADNVDGDASTQDLRDFIQSLLVHGVIGVLGNTTAQSFTTTPAVVELPSLLHSRHVTEDLVAYSLTIPTELTTGKYDVGWEINYLGQSGDSGRFTVAVYKNGSTKVVQTERVIDVVDGVVGHMYCRVPGITLAADDELQLTIKADGSKDLLIANAQLSVQRLGVE